MKVLITGANGFLGRRMACEFATRGEKVFGFARAAPNHPPCYEDIFIGDLSVPGYSEVLGRIFLRYHIDAVIHLAAQVEVGLAKRNPARTLQTNVLGTWEVLEAARMVGLQRVIIASSDKAYGRSSGEDGYTLEDELRAAGPYETSKACADLIAQSYRKTYGMPVSITRCGNLYGPGGYNRTALIPGTIISILNSRAPELRGDGLPIRDYVYIDDAVDAYYRLLYAADAPAAVNIGTGVGSSVIDVVKKIVKLMGWTGGIKRPELVPPQVGAELDRQVINPKDAWHDIGWKAKTDFDTGLLSTIDWHRSFDK